MDIQRAKEIIAKVLPRERLEHSFRVTEVSLELAEIYGVRAKDAKLAALLHDYAKHHPKDELKSWILNSSLPKNLLFYHSAIWHGPVGALMIKQKYAVNQRDVLNAIYCHTTGKENMSTLDKILFVADYIEPERDIPDIDEIRKVAKEDLDVATYLILKNTIKYLISKKHTIYPSTFYAYNELSEKLANQLEGSRIYER